MTAIVARKRLSHFSVCLLALSSTTNAQVHVAGQEAYPIDSSWAIKSATLADTFGDKQTLYDNFLKGCNEALQEKGDKSGSNCDDKHRLKLNLEQPAGMRVSCTRELTHWLAYARCIASFLVSHITALSLLELHEIGI
jgi:hypothetical protein